MKNKKIFIEDFLSRFWITKKDSIVWYYDSRGNGLKTIYSQDTDILYNDSRPKFYCFVSKRFFTPKQFIKHIRRIKNLKAFW